MRRQKTANIHPFLPYPLQLGHGTGASPGLQYVISDYLLKKTIKLITLRHTVNTGLAPVGHGGGGGLFQLLRALGHCMVRMYCIAIQHNMTLCIA